MVKQIVRLCFALTALLMSAFVYADAIAMPMPEDTRLVVFSYDPHNTYTVLSRPRSITDIKLHPDEEFVAMAIGDSVQWMTSKAKGHIFIKPLQPNIFTSATIVTNARTYELTLRSSPDDGKWYQRVSWDYPELIMAEMNRIDVIHKAEEKETKRINEQVISTEIPIESLNFEYKISGDADFKPAQVFDDGKFTWIRMPQLQELPAVFMIGEEGKGELINYVQRGPYFVIQRLVPGVLLKLGKQEVKIVNSKSAKSFMGFAW